MVGDRESNRSFCKSALRCDLKLTKVCLTSIQTDNAGVNDSPGSAEYFLAAKYFGLSYLRLWELAESGIDATFVEDTEKEELRRKFRDWREGIGSRWIK